MDLLTNLRARLPDNLVDLPVQIAVNQVYMREPVVLSATDEVAVIPPVQGG